MLQTDQIWLTDREKTILNCIKKGFITNDEIAHELGISVNTVAFRMCSLFIKFGLEKGKQPRAKLVYEVMK